MKVAQHHIKKQFLDFEFASKTEALKWQQRVAFQDQLRYEKAIESILDKYEDGRTHKIDKIIIDLGATTEAEVAIKIGEELDRVLQTIISNNTLSKNEATIDKEIQGRADINTINEKKELQYVFLYFIHQGHFPWNISGMTITKLEEQLLDQFSISDLVIALRSKKVLHQVFERQRFLLQFSEEFVQAIIPVYFKEEFLQLETVLNFCQKQFGLPQFASHFSNKKKNKNDTPIEIIEWITLNASNEPNSWFEEYTKWYMATRWVSKIPLSYAAVWDAIEQAKPNQDQVEIERLLKRVFRHMDLRIKAYETEGTFALNNIDELPKEGLSKGNKKDKLVVKDLSDVENEYIAQKKNLKKEQTAQSEEHLVIQKAKKEIEKPRKEHKTDGIKEAKDDALNDLESTSDTIESASQFQDEGVNVDTPVKEIDIQEEEFSLEIDGARQTLEDSNKTLDEHVDKELDPETSFSKVEEDFSSLKELEKPNELYPIVEDTIDRSSTEPFLNQQSNEAIGDELVDYYIKDSGLLLVWPYLHRLFDHLKYTKDKKFISRDLQERAVLLLGYMATGNPICEEHQLVFAKFLCNWPFKIPVKRIFEVTKEEEEEVHTMLSGLISHWSILKNTSVEGLRETFFWRDGKLEEKEEFWKLTVEQKATDILLSHLPFGISMIKLPWHKKMLRVDWA